MQKIFPHTAQFVHEGQSVGVDWMILVVLMVVSHEEDLPNIEVLHCGWIYM